MKRIGLAVIGTMLLGAGRVDAQGMRYGVGAGLLLPAGDYHSLDKPGWIVGGDVTYWFASASVAIRAEGSYSRTGYKQGACCFPNQTRWRRTRLDVGSGSSSCRPIGTGFGCREQVSRVAPMPT